MKNTSFKKKKYPRGFTLIELVVTLTVLGVLATFIGQPMIDLIQNRNRIEQKTDQEANIEYALSRITEEIRFRGSSIQCGSGAVRFGGNQTVYRWDSGTNQLIVKQEPPATRSVLVNNVSGFRCDTIKPVTDLHELVLESNSKIYRVRAFKRK